MKRLAFLASLLAVFIGLFTPLVRAQVTPDQTDEPNALNLTISPLPITMEGKPGDTLKTQLRVKNSGNKTEILKVGLMKFTAYGEEGKPQIKDREPGDDYFDWVSFSQTQFTAEPNVWQDLTMSIAIPKTAAFGYYYAVTFSRANPKTPVDPTTAVIRGGTATLILLEAKVPGAKRQLELESFQVSKKTFEFLPASFTVKLKNTGDVHTVPSGTIFISKGGKQIETIKVNETRGNTLPNSSRIFTTDWSSGFPVYQTKERNGSVVLADGKPTKELSWQLGQIKNLRFGKYNAHLTVVYDDGSGRDQSIDASVDFWVIPWRLLFIFIGIPLVLLGLIVYLFISRHRYKNRGYGARIKR